MPEPASLADENPVAKAYRVWSSTTPFMARSTMMTIVGTYLLSCLLPNLPMALNNRPHWTIMRFEVYRLVTTVFCNDSILTVVFGLMSFNNIGPKLERSFGSTGLLALIVTLTILTNVVFIALCFMLLFLGQNEGLFYSAAGIWNLLISLTAIECMASPHTPRRFWIFPFDIPGKYYPLFLAVVFGLMRSNFRDLFCAVGVGYAYADGRLDRLKPSRSRLAGWESGCLSNFVQRQGYITNGASQGDAALIAPLNNPADHPSNQGRSGGGGGGGRGRFSSFFGGGGQGGDEAGGGGGGLDGDESGFGSNNVIKKGGTSGKGGKDSFAGSGQTLGGGGGSRQSGGSQTRHDPERARLARLAALEGRDAGGGGRGGGGGDARGARGEGGRGGELATPLLAASDHRVQQLQDMGFTAAEANEALQYTNGDVEAAAAYLAT